jgi:hypothetical protein
MVQTFLKDIKRKNPFPNEMPGVDWCRGFEKRHPDVTKRKPELVTTARAKQLTAANIDLFFDMYEELVDRCKLRDHPERIFNIDETGLNCNPIAKKVYTAKKESHVYLQTPTCGKASTSVLIGCSAAAHYLPPFVIYKGASLHDTWTYGGPKGTCYAVTKSGWMQDVAFETWFLKVFLKFVSNLDKPVLLLFDGHNSHLTYPTVAEAMKVSRKKEIHLG